MGQPKPREIQNEIEEYIKVKGWASPQELRVQLNPKFPRYPKDTFQRLVQRNLKKSKKIIKHPLKAFYCTRQSKKLLDMMLWLGWYNMIYAQGYDTCKAEAEAE